LIESVLESCEDDLSSKAAASRVVEAVFESIAGALEEEDDVAVAGFGKFSTANRKARTARNPINGEDVAVPAKTVAKFKPATALKKRVNGD